MPPLFVWLYLQTGQSGRENCFMKIETNNPRNELKPFCSIGTGFAATTSSRFAAGTASAGCGDGAGGGGGGAGGTAIAIDRFS